MPETHKKKTGKHTSKNTKTKKYEKNFRKDGDDRTDSGANTDDDGTDSDINSDDDTHTDDEENGNEYRQALRKKFKLEVCPAKADGNCLFRSVSQQAFGI